MFTKFRYAEDFTLANTTASIPVNYIFRANSLNDPNFTGVGAQPRYYDTLCGANNGSAPYQRYCVLAAKITLTIFSLSDAVSSNPSYNGWMSIRALQSNSPPSSREEMCEGTYMTRIPLTNAQSGMPRKLKYYLSMKKFYGVKDVRDSLNIYGAQYNLNPAEQALFMVSMCPQTDVTGATYSVMANIKYYAQLYDPNDVANS